jgi:mutator protein MutT
MIEQFVSRLNDRILSGLPGILAHRIMSPSTRPLIHFDENDYPKAKKGSVLVLFFPQDDSINMVFIKRPSYDGVHSGQVAFPGGKIEEGESPEQAALRETKEEIGVPENKIILFNHLSNLYIPPSNFFVFPFLGYMAQRPEFIPDKNEVEYVIETPVEILLDPSIKGVMEIKRMDEIIKAPYYLIQGQQVWGATAIILSELEFLLTEPEF